MREDADKKIPYGARVSFTSYYARTTGYEAEEIKKFWDVIATPGSRIGLFLGYRTIVDGRVYWLGPDGGGWCFMPEQYKRVAYVSPGTQQNPIYVPLDSIELLAKTGGGDK